MTTTTATTCSSVKGCTNAAMRGTLLCAQCILDAYDDAEQDDRALAFVRSSEPSVGVDRAHLDRTYPGSRGRLAARGVVIVGHVTDSVYAAR